MSFLKNRIICNLIIVFVAFCCFVVSLCCFLAKCQEYFKNRKNHEYKKILSKKILIKNSTLKIKKMFSKKMKKVGKKFWFKEKSGSNLSNNTKKNVEYKIK